MKIAGNNPQIRQWWYDVMILRPPPLPKHEGKHREEILDRVEEGWLEEDWEMTMPQVINEILQNYSTSLRNPTDLHVPHYRGYTRDTNGRIEQSPNKQMSYCTRAAKQKTEKTGRDQGQKHE